MDGSGTTLIVPVAYRLPVFQLMPFARGGKLTCEKLPVVPPVIRSKLWPAEGVNPLANFTSSAPLSVAWPETSNCPIPLADASSSQFTAALCHGARGLR